MFTTQSLIPSLKYGLATLVTVYNKNGHYQSQGWGNLPGMYENWTYKKALIF